ncbi:hypothetical protein [Pontibacillus marinus]|uniref:hypothetical protein n=1 Tax=Pontibacillus marinus TaxID=273164 RepID=UPI000413764B|nr:hypothetical protein [Pontibacillus marinus]
MSTIYFTDNFFSAGKTEIYNDQKEQIGTLDLKGAFSSDVMILNNNEEVLLSGGFRFFSRKWFIQDQQEQEIGELAQRFAFFSKKYEYEAYDRGLYRIESESFSRDYEIYDEQESLVGEFHRTDGFFESPAFCLTNHTEVLTDDELIAVVMGVNMIEKRNSSNAANGAGGAT